MTDEKSEEQDAIVVIIQANVFKPELLDSPALRPLKASRGRTG